MEGGGAALQNCLVLGFSRFHAHVLGSSSEEVVSLGLLRSTPCRRKVSTDMEEDSSPSLGGNPGPSLRKFDPGARKACPSEVSSSVPSHQQKHGLLQRAENALPENTNRACSLLNVNLAKQESRKFPLVFLLPRWLAENRAVRGPGQRRSAASQASYVFTACECAILVEH